MSDALICVGISYALWGVCASGVLPRRGSEWLAVLGMGLCGGALAAGWLS